MSHHHHHHGAGILLGVGALAALGTAAAVSSMNRGHYDDYYDDHCDDHCSGSCCSPPPPCQPVAVCGPRQVVMCTPQPAAVCQTTVRAAPVQRQQRPRWQPDSEAPRCTLEHCKAAFNWTNSRHHCRKCGFVVCGRCSTVSLKLPELGYFEPVRVCDQCVANMRQQVVQQPPPPQPQPMAAPVYATPSPYQNAAYLQPQPVLYAQQSVPSYYQQAPQYQSGYYGTAPSAPPQGF